MAIRDQLMQIAHMRVGLIGQSSLGCTSIRLKDFLTLDVFADDPGIRFQSHYDALGSKRRKHAEGTNMKSALRRVIRAFGYDVRRYHPNSSEASRFSRMLKYHRINLCLDVGANIGQAGLYFRNYLDYRGRIVSFEPMEEAYASLCAVSKNDKLWKVAPRCAIGSRNGEIEINISSNSVSSSILPMLEAHGVAAPESRYEARETVPLKTLDTAALPYLNPESRTFLKVDTQGYELHVLEGASNIISSIVGVALEVSLIPLYAGQQLMPEVVDYMAKIGFFLWGVAPAFVVAQSGRTLQFDAIFFRGDETPAPEV